ncbi:MAG: B12-binding domain-containing radical SAM protein [Acidobacteriia bacterium]|nr:B12-binding domain-containing radical SAM protein [Terriglobia bacterium]
MARVILVNPSMSTVGYSIITPRWLYVIAQATPGELVGEPILVDESIEQFDPAHVRPGDIVGIGITTGNCIPGYRVMREAKSRGAKVIMGGIHATIFPEEPLEMGADAVVTGSGEVVWGQVVKDAVENNLRRKYDGGRVAGDAMLKAKWDLLDPAKYIFPTVQTVAGCPENCSFCSVWVTEGRQPRQRLSDKVIEEVNELYDLGFRYIVFADDNFNPSTLGRIAREPGENKRKELEQIREDRLKFFDEYDRNVPRDMFAFAQMTAEATSDEEYLQALYHKMRIRTALIGVESFSEEGLKSVGKLWNPIGQEMVEAIQRIQDCGIYVLSSIISGLESDTVQTIRTMRKFATESGTLFAQFTVFNPYPGTKDFYEMMNDKKYRGKPDFVAKHTTQILQDRYWLKPLRPVDIVKHQNITMSELHAENKKCWDSFYSIRESLKRTRRGRARRWSWGGKMAYLFACLAFRGAYAGYGMAADSVRRKNMGFSTKILIKTAANVFNRFYRQKKLQVRVSMRAH